MTREEAKSCICTIKMLQRLAYNIHGVMDVIDADNCKKIIKALEQEPCEDVVSRNAIIQTLNNMDRYVANELILCDTNNKFPQNEVFIVDDVFEQIAEQLPSVTPKQQTCEDCISRQAAIDCLTATELKKFDFIIQAREAINNLPHVTPTHKEWIPVPEGATNKDMFKTVFGYEPATDAVVCNKEDWCGASKPCNYCFGNPNAIGREEEWWNAPYKAEREE